MCNKYNPTIQTINAWYCHFDSANLIEENVEIMMTVHTFVSIQMMRVKWMSKVLREIWLRGVFTIYYWDRLMMMERN